MQPTILIASNSKDRPNYEPVLTILQRRKHGVLVYDAQAVMTGEKQFSITMRSGAVRFKYGGHVIDPHGIKAAWIRRASATIPAKDKANELRLHEERRACQYLLWKSISHQAWLNEPDTIVMAQHKIHQFAVASSIGLVLPPTIVSNNWQEIIDTLPGDKVIYKMVESGRLYNGADDAFVYTNVFEKSLAKLPVKGLPIPGLWQAYVPKEREWRVTVVGGRVFPVAIDTSHTAKDDWRRLQTDPQHVQFSSKEFPQAISDKCIQLLKALDLRFGAFDFIETPAGEFVFLEVNPNGQYMWLLHHGVPIADAIADELIAIAAQN